MVHQSDRSPLKKKLLIFLSTQRLGLRVINVLIFFYFFKEVFEMNIEKLIQKKLQESNISIKFEFSSLFKATNEVACITPEKDLLLFNPILKDSDFQMYIEEEYDVPFVDYLDAVISHELGHFLDKFLLSSSKTAEYYFQEGDYFTYYKIIYSIEERAYHLGSQFACNKSIYKSINKTNLNNYLKRISIFEEVSA